MLLCFFSTQLYVYSIVDIDQILFKVPLLKDVLNLLMPIKDKLYTIGVSLEVDIGELNCLKSRNNSAEMNLLTVIVKCLERMSNEATWKVLLEEVEGPIVKNRKINNEIRAFLRKPDIYTKYIN